MPWQRYAKDCLGKIVNIHDVTDSYITEYGNDSFTCPGCGCTVISKRGKIREHHFAHVSGQEGACSFETYLHKVGISKFIEVYKKRMEEKKDFLLEVAKGGICYKGVCPYGKKEACGYINGYETLILLPEFTSCEREVRDGRFIPDILLSAEDGRKVYIEIAVTHLVKESKIESGIPIVEIKLKSESDIAMFEEGFISQRNKQVKMYNFDQCMIPIDYNCEPDLQKEKELFIQAFRQYRSNHRPFFIKYDSYFSCNHDCPYLEGHPCIKKDSGVYDIAKKCTELSPPSSNSEFFSPDFYIQNTKGEKIRFNFAFQLFPKSAPFNNEKTIQFAIERYGLRPWSLGRITNNNKDTRYFNFESKAQNLCAGSPQLFQIITLHKDDTVIISDTKPINEIHEAMAEKMDQIVDYILIPTSEYFFNQHRSTASLRNLLEKKCEGCIYFDEFESNCRNNNQECAPNKARDCKYFKRDFRAAYGIADRPQYRGYEDILGYWNQFRLKFSKPK